MGIIASIPYVIKKTVGEITVYIAVIPPIVTKDEFLDELPKSGFSIEKACKGDKALCYAKAFGGVVISNGKSFVHKYLEGYVYEGDRGEEFTPYRFEENPYNCFTFNDSTLCFTKERRGRMIDNVGLRYIITDN